MTNVIDSAERELPPPTGSLPPAPPILPPTSPPSPPTSPPSPPTSPPSPPTSPRPASPSGSQRERTGWHVAAIVVGCLMLLPALGMVMGGTVATVGVSVADDGYFDVTIERVESTGVAVAAVDLWDEAAQDEDWPWVLDWLDLDIRIRADGAGSTDEVFIGIARSDDVEAYLSDAAFDELTDFVDRRPIYASRNDSNGEVAIAPPTEQTFWVSQAAGPGEQQLDWEARNGDWSVVVMNADGSADVAADVTVGVRSGAVLPIGITLIVFGAIGTIISLALIIVGARGRHTT